MPTQVENAISEMDKATRLPTGEAPPVDFDAPRVPFITDLKLTADQERKMIDHAFTRRDQICNETGRDNTLNPIWWNNQTWGASVALQSQGLLPVGDTFFGKRSRYDATFLNDVSWRPFTMGPSTIFNESNISVPITRRIARQMIAKAKNAFFGVDDWFSVDPMPVANRDGVDDEQRNSKIEKFCQFKLREADTREDMGDAIEAAFIFGECAVKTSYVVRDQIFNVEATVLHSVDGEPVRAADGNFITQEDTTVPEDGTGRILLERDGVTEVGISPIWQKTPLDRRQVLFEGAKSEVIYYKDFLCPLTATDVQTADFCAHLYDKPVMAFVDLVVKRGMIDDTSEERISAARKMFSLVKDISDNSPQPKAGVTMSNRPNDHYASTPSVETGGPVAEFMECYMWYDANGDGIAENIMLIVDKTTRAPIFYDHVANVTTDGLRPIEIVRINPVRGRWYGQGLCEMFESYQTITDLLVNRWNFSQSRSGRVDLWTPTNTLEGDRDPTLKMNWGGTYTKKPGMKKEDVLESVYLTDIKFDQVQTMIQFFLQLCLNESGVATANDDQAAGMQSSKLATGIIETTKSGDELFKPLLMDLQGPMTRVLNRTVDVTLANLNPVEVYTFLEGDTMGIDQITPDDVRGLKYKTNITLSAHKNMERVQMSAQAAQLVEKFYGMPPEVQIHVVEFYRQQLRVFSPTTDADATLVVTLPTGIPGPGGKPAGGPQSTGANAAAPAQLMQKNAQPTGQTAPGGTPPAS